MPTAGRITLVSCFRGLSLIWKTVVIVILAFLISIGLSLCLSMVWSPPVSHIDYPPADKLSCIRCGEDGKCKNNATETLVECAENELTCMLTSEHEEQFIYEVKNCYSTGQDLRYVGCLKITSDMPGGEDEQMCLCDQNGCNEHHCDTKMCDCPFADPDHCIKVDPDAPPISCRHCEGDACLDGKTGELKVCTAGESSCLYMNANVNNKTIISRSCFYEANGARLQGCVQLEDGDSFSGEFCYCNTDDCNVQTCDHRFCDCPYSDPNECIKTIDPDDEHIVHCKTCVGEGGDACDDGENVKSEPCIMGEKSCLYGKTTIEYSPDNVTTIITRSCAFYEDNSHNLNNIAVNGCVKVKEVKDELGEPGFVGDYCYCDGDNCNAATCDPLQCDCVYADSNNCRGNGAARNNLGALFFILTCFASFIVSS